MKLKLRRLKLKLKLSLRGISPILAVLMMIVVAVAAGLVTYAWVMGYLGFTTGKAGKAIQIQSLANSGSDLLVYVQNVGDGVVEFDPAACVYVNGVLRSCVPDPVLLEEGKTATLTVEGAAVPAGSKVTVKVVTTGGAFMEKTTFEGESVLPTPTPTPTPTPPPPTVTRVQGVFRNIALSGTGVGSGSFVDAPTEGNLLVVVAGHRQGNPQTYNAPTIAGWTRHDVEWDYTTATGSRRIVAIFTKRAAAGESSTVTINWNDNTGDFSSGFMILQEFTGANSYTYVASEGYGSAASAVTTLQFPVSPLSAGGNVNILAIAGMVWRDDEAAIAGVAFNNLGGVLQGLSSPSSSYGVSAFDYTAGAATVLQTTATLTGASPDPDMASGLLVLFSCS